MSPLPTPVELLEAEVAREEESLNVELQKALTLWREAAARLKGLSASLDQAVGLGMNVGELFNKVSALKLPQLEQGNAMLRAEALRRETVAARRAGAQELKSRIPAFIAAVSQLSLKISAEEGAVLKQVGMAKAIAAQVAEAAKKLDDSTAIGRVRTVKREQSRVRMQVKIDFQSENNFYSGFSTNLSDGGVFIATVKLVPIGTPMDLYFRLPTGEGIEAHGVVRWVREIDDTRPEMMPGLGVQFTDLSEAAKAAVIDFVRTREPMFYPD